MNGQFSYNWTGVRVKNDKFGGKRFTSVRATWKVHVLKGNQGNQPLNQKWHVANLVGLDGGSNLEGWSQNVLQAGIAQTITNDAGGNPEEERYAWYRWDPVGTVSNDPYQIMIKPEEFPIKPGDSVTVTLSYLPLEPDATKGFVKFQNGSAPPVIRKFYVDPNQFKGDTIEWVIERPAANGGTGGDRRSRKPLARFPDAVFTDAGGWTADNVSGNPNVFPSDGDVLTMEEDNSTPANRKEIANATPSNGEIKVHRH
jgi:hypothetical protein